MVIHRIKKFFSNPSSASKTASSFGASKIPDKTAVADVEWRESGPATQSKKRRATFAITLNRFVKVAVLTLVLVLAIGTSGFVGFKSSQVNWPVLIIAMNGGSVTPAPLAASANISPPASVNKETNYTAYPVPLPLRELGRVVDLSLPSKVTGQKRSSDVPDDEEPVSVEIPVTRTKTIRVSTGPDETVSLDSQKFK